MYRLFSRRRNTDLFLFSVFWPFFGLVQAILHPRNAAAKNLVWLFIVYYGMSFYISASSGDDSVRYVENLSFMHNKNFGFGDLLNSFYNSEGFGGYQDIYQPLVTFAVSRFTDGQWLLFGAFAILLGYVYSRNVWFLIDKFPACPGLTLWVLVVAFAFIQGIGLSLNGVRMWTALHVFIYGIFHFSSTGQRKFLVVAILAPLIHFSFLVVSVGLLVFLMCSRFGVRYLGIKRFARLVFVFFVVSFLVSSIDFSLIRSGADYMPTGMSDRAINGYIDRADPSALADNLPIAQIWFLTLNGIFVKFFIFVSSAWLFFRKAYERGGVITSLFIFGMFSYAVVNLVGHIPSAGRFFKIGEMLIIASQILFLADQTIVKKIDYKMASVELPMLSLHIALGFRFLLEYASLWLVTGNFFIVPFIGSDVGLYEFFKVYL